MDQVKGKMLPELQASAPVKTVYRFSSAPDTMTGYLTALPSQESSVPFRCTNTTGTM